MLQINGFYEKHNIFSTIIILAPIMVIYSTFINSITLTDVLIVAYILLFGALNIRKCKLYKPLLFFIAFILFNLVLSLIFEEYMVIESQKIFFRTMRYVLYLATIAVFAITEFNFDVALKTYRLFSIFSSLYSVLQYILYNAFAYYLPGYVPFFKLYDSELIWHATIGHIFDGRPRSIFAEPQMFATFVLGYFSLVLFKDKYSMRDYVEMFVIVLSILLTTSSTGIIAMLLLIFIRIVSQIIKSSKISFSILLIPVFVSIIFLSNPMQLFLHRMTSNSSVNHRFEAYIYLFKESFYFKDYILGNAMFETNAYGFMPTYLRTIFYFGIPGLIILIYLLFKLNKYSSFRSQGLVYLIIILNVGTVDFYGPQILVYLGFILSERSNSDMIRSKK